MMPAPNKHPDKPHYHARHRLLNDLEGKEQTPMGP